VRLGVRDHGEGQLCSQHLGDLAHPRRQDRIAHEADAAALEHVGDDPLERRDGPRELLVDDLLGLSFDAEFAADLLQPALRGF
jgi:hypothetical protein